ncbi:MAG TPA: tetrahydromethanopterin S-methyltransferase subunit G [Methanothermococcus okinawensis]|uniref:Tetrahydromethanopterin S-methyltransferase subunit G n=1 Tax=Methanothermococcus okinawensis TaxID=155863 RepID=A0A833E153_9EURY|nr:tetrahydromethanopterin S-methyltransferase subunit G [Methanothermococcus okinawensis]
MVVEKPPAVITPSKDFKELMEKLDEIEEMVDNTNAEIMQRLGKKIGRDIGIIYGFIIGFIITILVGKLMPNILLFIKMG